jgi:DNA-binding CsgD family transcriptional regulator
MVNVSYPVPWVDLYLSGQFDRIDPVVAEHRRHPGLQYWADSFRKHPEAREFIRAASAYGLKTGYSYGLRRSGNDDLSLFSFAGRSMRKSIRTALIVESIVPYLHLALIRIVGPLEARGQDVALSPREKEVLKWVKAGKTSWEISRILSVSECTVNFHVQHILRKVHAVTRAQAVAICVEEGLIDID